MTYTQYIVAKKILLLTFYLVKVFGLWPYNFDLLKRQIDYSFFGVIYSIIVPVLILTLYVYVLIGSEMYNAATHTTTFASWTLQFVVSYSHMVLISYILLYIGQHFQSKQTKLAYFKCKKVADCMEEYQRKFVDVKKYIINFLFKTLVCDFLNLSIFFLQYDLGLR